MTSSTVDLNSHSNNSFAQEFFSRNHGRKGIMNVYP